MIRGLLLLSLVQVPDNALQVGELDLLHIVLADANAKLVATEPPIAHSVENRFQDDPYFVLGIRLCRPKRSEIVAHQRDVDDGVFPLFRQILPQTL